LGLSIVPIQILSILSQLADRLATIERLSQQIKSQSAIAALSETNRGYDGDRS
jgi:hypothetical protein